MLVTPHQKIVAQRQEHMDGRLARDLSKEASKLRLRLRRRQREQLLELVDHDESLVVGSSPTAEQLEGRLGILEARELAQRLGVPGELWPERLAKAPQRRGPRRADDRRPALGPGGHHTSADERRLARARGTNHREKPSPA